MAHFLILKSIIWSRKFANGMKYGTKKKFPLFFFSNQFRFILFHLARERKSERKKNSRIQMKFNSNLPLFFPMNNWINEWRPETKQKKVFFPSQHTEFHFIEASSIENRQELLLLWLLFPLDNQNRNFLKKTFKTIYHARWVNFLFTTNETKTNHIHTHTHTQNKNNDQKFDRMT